MQWVCAGLLRGGVAAAAPAIRHACPSQKAPAEHRRAGLGIRGSSLHCGHSAAHRSPSVLMGGGKNGVSRLSHPQRREFVPTAVQEALGEE